MAFSLGPGKLFASIVCSMADSSLSSRARVASSTNISPTRKARNGGATELEPGLITARPRLHTDVVQRTCHVRFGLTEHDVRRPRLNHSRGYRQLGRHF